MVLDSWNVHTSPLIGTVRTGLSEAGLDFGVFGFSKDASLPTTPMPADVKRKTRFANGNGSGSGAENNTDADENSGEEEEEVERESRPVIKLRSKRIGRNLSRSRSRRDLTQAAEDQHRPHTPDPAEETVANVRFSAHNIAKSDITAIMPFALIAPEAKRRRHQQLLSGDNGTVPPSPASPVPPSEDGHAASVDGATPSVHSSKHNIPLPGPPEDLKGVFTRKFRWGTVDVLNPDHCDFSALRTSVLSTHLKVRVSVSLTRALRS